jgi:NAD dependent epimerase/dehydratase
LSVNWSDRNVVVTGAGGFIGSHLVERLVEEGANVTAFVRYNSRNDAGLLEQLEETKQAVRVVRGDVRDLETVHALFRGAEIVLHLAALVGIPYSYVHVSEVVSVNTFGTLNVLTGAKENGIEKVVIASTSEVYGTARTVPMDESHPKQPQSPYSASKIGADALGLSFQYAFGLPVAVVRPFNTYGPRQSDRAIIPTIISQALQQDEVVLGSLTPTRDFTFVTDTVDGFVKAAETEASTGEEINLGSGTEISIGDLAARVARALGRDIAVRQADERVRPDASEVDRLCSDNAKAARLLGWRPEVGLDEGLEQTIEWVRDHPELYSPSLYRI